MIRNRVHHGLKSLSKRVGRFRKSGDSFYIRGDSTNKPTSPSLLSVDFFTVPSPLLNKDQWLQNPSFPRLKIHHSTTTKLSHLKSLSSAYLIEFGKYSPSRQRSNYRGCHLNRSVRIQHVPNALPVCICGPSSPTTAV